MITQKSLLTQTCSFAGKDGSNTQGIIDVLNGVDMSNKCVNGTTAADRHAFNCPAFDGAAVVETFDDLCRNVLGADGWLDNGGSDGVMDEIDGNDSSALPPHSFMTTALDSLRSTIGNGGTGNNQVRDAPSGYALTCSTACSKSRCNTDFQCKST